jgi:hypothetical protein
MKNDHQHEIPIQIDHRPYKAPKTPMTSQELRVLADPDIGEDRDLWLTVPGPGDDRLINDGDSLDLKAGMHFYTAPRSINPGACHALA